MNVRSLSVVCHHSSIFQILAGLPQMNVTDCREVFSSLSHRISVEMKVVEC
jgi:hypothetical protein